jgi:hypothetical protein
MTYWFFWLGLIFVSIQGFNSASGFLNPTGLRSFWSGLISNIFMVPEQGITTGWERVSGFVEGKWGNVFVTVIALFCMHPF